MAKNITPSRKKTKKKTIDEKNIGNVMNKLVIVINGQGRSGKDTICKITAKRYKIKNVSAIDPVKKIAAEFGWQGEKDDKARKMLADLKQILIAYNDYPFKYIMQNVSDFMLSDEQIMFAHIRESDEIAKVVKACGEKGVNVLTLLVKRNDKFFVKKTYGNAADDGVENYPYDLIYSGNNDTVEYLEKDFNEFFDKNIKVRL